jgi:hypothetical protein
MTKLDSQIMDEILNTQAGMQSLIAYVAMSNRILALLREHHDR